MKKAWQEVAAEQQRIRDATIPTEWVLKNPPADTVVNVMDVPYTCGVLTKRELELTDKDATRLLKLLAEGDVTSYEVTLAFCKRCAIAQQLVNCCTQLWFEEGLERAKELDAIFARTKKPIGPYHGLPFSIKDQFNMKGKITSAGFLAWVDNLCSEDSPTVRILREAGAVFYCKTNNPQTVMHLETNSNVHGRTLNPFNRNLTPGGSSGGEGALVALHGSPIGLGADGGGSIRCPAANNGLFGLKSTPERIPKSGCTVPMAGCNTFPVVVGPICRSARDNYYFHKVIIDAEPWRIDPWVVALPWRELPLPNKITVGIFSWDRVCMPHPPITAAIKILKQKLESHPDFEVVDWEPYDHDRGYDIIRRLYYEDAGENNYNTMTSTGEPSLALSDWIMKPPFAKRCTVEEAWALNVRRADYQKEYLVNWSSHPKNPDFLLLPVGPSAAPRHDTARYWSYTAVYNLLEYPACTFPTGLLCSPEAHPVDASYKPLDNEHDAYNWNNYDPEIFKGAPICLQVVGKKWDCERTMKVAGVASDIMNAYSSMV